MFYQTQHIVVDTGGEKHKKSAARVLHVPLRIRTYCRYECSLEGRQRMFSVVLACIQLAVTVIMGVYFLRQLR